MIYFKSCPRCHAGDMIVERDQYGWSVLCLQCGYMKDLRDFVEAKDFIQQARQSKTPVAAA